jgi:uncharacterized linocin/CFP29 family protein
MVDYLQRDQAPVSAEQWRALDRAVVDTARGALIGRRILSLVGPLGGGVEVLPNDVIGGTGAGQVDLVGAGGGDAIGLQRRRFLPLPLIYKDFWLHWRDLESSRLLGTPLDTGKAAAAAAATAQAEDRLVFLGDDALELPGLLTVPGRQERPLGDWGSMGRAFDDVVAGVEALVDAGFTGPYALVVSPRLYAQLNRVFRDTGVLELEQVEKLARRGVYPTAVLPEPAALLADTGAQNVDLAVGLDLSTAYVESSDLNHRFRVLESLVLRIRRPGAIVTFRPPGVPAEGAGGEARGRRRP